MLQTLEEPEVMMDINTTPLIDVMLVLLIMLIITIPIAATRHPKTYHRPNRNRRTQCGALER